MEKVKTERHQELNKMEQLNAISPSMCAAKWYDATIWLYSGRTASCHHTASQAIDLGEIRKNPAAIHNTSQKKEMRQLMQKGKRPKECEYCWKMEDLSPGNLSDRYFKSSQYDIEDIRNLAESSWKKDVILKNLEIALDRTCNFACMYCNPIYSSSWVKDIQKNGPYKNIPTDKTLHYSRDYAEMDSYRGQENPYVEAFWKWWPELKKNLKLLRVTGGEPLMTPHFWKLLESFKEDGNTEMEFAVNSNLGAKTEIIKKLAEATHSVRHFELYTSNEAYGKQAEYIRDGLDYDLWKSNFELLMDQGNVKKIHVMMTISGLCLFSMTQFLDQCIEWKKKYGQANPTLSFNIIRWPTFQSPLVLPPYLRQEVTGRLENWFNEDNSRFLSGYEKAQIMRLIDYLKNAESATADAAPREALAQDLYQFILQYDRRRGKSYQEVFEPKLVQWLQSLCYL